MRNKKKKLAAVCARPLVTIYTEYKALNGNKIKHYTSSTIKYSREIDIFSNTGPHKVPYVLSRCQYGTISGTSHIKTICSFWQGIMGKHLIGNALCSSDDSVRQLIHISLFFTRNNAFYKPPEKNPEELKSEETGNQEMGRRARFPL
jgi:hypothetical protein